MTNLDEDRVLYHPNHFFLNFPRYVSTYAEENNPCFYFSLYMVCSTISGLVWFWVATTRTDGVDYRGTNVWWHVGRIFEFLEEEDGRCLIYDWYSVDLLVFFGFNNNNGSVCFQVDVKSEWIYCHYSYTLPLLNNNVWNSDNLYTRIWCWYKNYKIRKKKKKIQNTPKKNELCFWLNFGGYLVV